MTIPIAGANVFATVNQIQGLVSVLPSKTQPMLLASVKFEEETMRKTKDRMIQFLMLGLLGVSLTFTFGQLTTKAQSQPACAGLQCTAQEDCGSKCFCNRPSGGCFSDADLLPE